MKFWSKHWKSSRQEFKKQTIKKYFIKLKKEYSAADVAVKLGMI